MKYIIGLFLVLVGISCNAPEQNSAVGNSQDSTTVNSDNQGTGTTVDTANAKADSSDYR